jgi:cytochrome c
MERFLPNWKFANPIDLKLASDGSIYMLEYGPLWFSGSPEAQLSRISFVAGNRTPDARIAADRTVGGLPLAVAFSADQAEDPDGDDLSYAWTIDGTVVSEAPTFSHTFERPGRFTARLTVTDPDGESATAEQAILAGNALPELSLGLKGNRMFFWENQPVSYAVTVEDEEDGTVGSGIDPSSVTVTIDYLPVGEDLVEPALGHLAMMEASQALIGKRLVEGGTCTACHQVDQASVGPAFVRVAEKYEDDAGAVEVLARKVMRGGVGVWGDIAMPAHPDLSPEEAQKMVEYVLSLGEHGRAVAGLPLQGTYDFTAHRGQQGEGQYILMASYTDRGANGVSPLTAREVVTLRPPRLQAWAFDAADGGQRFTVPEDAPGGMGGQDILLAEHGGFTRFEGIDLTGVAGITATFAVAPGYTTGGFVDVYLDDRGARRSARSR